MENAAHTHTKLSPALGIRSGDLRVVNPILTLDCKQEIYQLNFKIHYRNQ